MILDDEVVGPVCISNIHTTDVPATVRGTWMERDGQYKTPGVWYCDECAKTGVTIGLFTPDANV